MVDHAAFLVAVIEPNCVLSCQHTVNSFQCPNCRKRTRSIIAYVTVGDDDIARAKQFYSAFLPSLDCELKRVLRVSSTRCPNNRVSQSLCRNSTLNQPSMDDTDDESTLSACQTWGPRSKGSFAECGVTAFLRHHNPCSKPKRLSKVFSLAR